MSDKPQFTIVPAESPSDIAAVTVLFTNYVAFLNIDLTYQNFAEELRSLPGKYSSERGGALLIAKSADGTVLGCIGLRRFAEHRAEMKRLWVSEEGRGLGLGRRLVDAVVEAGRRLGYKEIVLDTLPSMEAARKMYRDHGFVEIPAYYDSPVKETLFLRKTY